MSSEDSFPYPGKVQPGDVFEVFRNHEDPVLSTTEIDGDIDWASRSTVHRQLVSMRENGQLKSKKSGTKDNAGVVWYPSDEIEPVPPATPDPIKLIYRYPWFSLLVGGFFLIGFGFIVFIPGYFGEGNYIWNINRDVLVYAGVFLYGFGISIAIISGMIIIAQGIIRTLNY